MRKLQALSAAVIAALCTLSFASPAAAQRDADETAQAEPAEKLDEILVTGTHIRGIDLQEAQPVTVIDAEDIRQFGAVTVGDLVAQLAETRGGTGTFSTANSGALQADTPAGAAAVSLRGLGTASTLTLVNGRRIAVSSFASGSENFVDVNAIPLAAIDRIEVLTTGASAIYGADAVAGVVNFILRDDFDGLRLSASVGDSEAATDELRANTNLVAGFVGERSRGMLVFDAFNRNALYDRDRAITAVEPRPSQQGVFPSFNDLADMPLDLVEAGCPDAQRFDGRPGFPASRFGAYCAVNRNAFTPTDPETQRYGLYTTYQYEIAEGAEYFTEFALQRNRSRAASAPAPWSEEEIAFNHPGMPAELRARLVAAGADPRFPIFGWGRFPDAREIEVTTRSWRWLNGLRGSAGAWDWETTATVSRSRSTQNAIAGIYGVERFRAALQGRLCASGATTCSASSGGLFYNPFGGQTGNSAQVLDLLREEVPRDGQSDLLAFDAKLSRLWGELAGGSIGWALGIEGRREDIEDRPSPLATLDPDTGEVPVYGFGSTAVQADRSQQALYAEVFLPFTSALDLRVAARYDHYSDFGGDFNPALSLRWQPHENVVLRSGWNTSFRAPSLAQVGAGTTLGSGALPCSPGSEFFQNFCGGFSGDDGYLSEIYGNPDLEAETSSAWYLGSAFSFGERTTLTLDYWNFDQKNLVDIDDLELFRRALTDPSLVSRTAELPSGRLGIGIRNGRIGGNVEQVNLQLINVGRQRTDGIDIGFEHRFDERGWGRLRLIADATWFNSFERSESCGGSDSRRGAGTCRDGQRLVERVGEFRYPEWTVNAGFAWSQGDRFARLFANYVDGYFDDDQRDGVAAGRRVGSWTTLNLTLGQDFGAHHSLSLTVRNLADRDPPIALGAATNVDLYNHDTLGRFWTLNYVYRL
ncbi:MAG: TonB-dependent receptor [Xanthomonadales bacterium]|nr:TonB-dependent receptor [Xanthomonadales bacterium]